MAKKFAEITGIHRIFKSETPNEEPNNGTSIYTEMFIGDDEPKLQENIDKNTIIFVTADDTDVDRIIGPNNYKISKDDCFIIAQNKVYATFGKVNVSDVMGPTGEDGLTPHIDPSSGNWFIGSENTEVPARGENGVPGQNGAGSVSDLIGLNNTEYATFPTDSLVEGDYGISKEGDVWKYDGSSMINSGVNLKGQNGAPGTPGAPGETSGGNTEIKDTVPIGAITMYAGEQNPDGWLFCNGASISIKSISNINIPGRGPGPDGEEIFTTSHEGEQVKWQIADKNADYLCDLLKIIKDNYGIDRVLTEPY